MDLFAYGTLVFPPVLEAVTGRRLAVRPAVLDAYEGELYVRRTLSVVCGGARRPAQVYVTPAERAGSLSVTPWDPAIFGRHHLAAWVQSHRRDRP